jgi:hypothetical protein
MMALLSACNDSHLQADAAQKAADTGASVTPSPLTIPAVTPPPPMPPSNVADPKDSDDSGGHGKRGGREGLNPPRVIPPT